jgi:lipopolysaccharide biosynthesis glycosyltransferase
MSVLPITAAVHNDDSFHIAFCVDNHYFRSMGATIASVIANNPQRRFTFHVFAFAIPDAQCRRLDTLEQNPNITVRRHVVDQAVFSEFSEMIRCSYYSLSTFTRLVIPSLLKDVTDKVLYLDADMLCVGNIDELAAMDISDTIAVVISDVGWKNKTGMDGRYTVLNLENRQYFNAGVIYINITEWERNGVSDATMRTLLQTDKKLDFNDQDALNIVLDGRARYVPVKWNYIYSMIADLTQGKLRMAAVGDAVFIHFAGAIKPWNDWSGHDACDLFRKYHALSAWSDMPLDQEPLNYKEMRICAGLRMKQGKMIAWLYWYASYLRNSFGRKIKRKG